MCIMPAEEVTEAQLPFGMGSIDFSNPKMAVFAIISLVLGFSIFSIASGFGDVVAARVNNQIQRLTGVSASSDGATSQAPGVV